MVSFLPKLEAREFRMDSATSFREDNLILPVPLVSNQQSEALTGATLNLVVHDAEDRHILFTREADSQNAMG